MEKTDIKSWTLFKKKLRGLINAKLEYTHNHYTCFLPGKTGALSSFILNRLFAGIIINKDQLVVFKQMPKNAIIVYVTKLKSRYEYHFYYTYFKRAKLPYPKIAFNYTTVFRQPVSRLFKVLLAHVDFFLQNFNFPDPYLSGYIRKELLRGSSALFSLVEKHGFYHRAIKDRTDPVQYLIEVQKTTDRPIYIIPQLMFFSKKPHKSVSTLIDSLFGPEQRPGILRRIVTLIKKSNKIFVEISQPVHLKKFLAGDKIRQMNIEHQSLILRRDLLFQINQHRRSTIGPTIKSREELKENILTGDRLREYMLNYSSKRSIPLTRVYKEADAYLEEIAADYKPGVIQTGSVIIKWFLNTIFEGISLDREGLSRIKEMGRRGPVILIPCHKSHIDYLILSYVLYNNNLPCPHAVAGKNLFFWPISYFLRSVGAFSIRRSFRGAVFYTKIFSEYIHELLKEGFNIELFFEGTRSRTGKLIMPKLGFITMLLDAYKNRACADMIFAPVFIGYDNVPEESAYLNEIKGKEKKAESFLEIIKARKILKKRYGRIYINFHTPISLKDLLEENNLSIHEMTSKEKNAFCRSIGHRITNSIEKVTVATPNSIVSSAVLNQPKNTFSYTHLKSHIDMYLRYLKSQNAGLADTFTHDSDGAIEHVCNNYEQRKFIENISRGQKKDIFSPVYMINDNKRPNLEYYKNNSIVFFIPAAYTALSIIEKDTFQFSASDLHPCYIFLKDLFQKEFISDMDKTPEYLVRKNIKAFIDESILIPHTRLPDTYSFTPAGLKKLTLFSTFLKTYFESYLIVLYFFKKYSKNSIHPKERLKKIQATGAHMYQKKIIERKEALSKINYQNAIELFLGIGIKGAENTDKINVYLDKIKRYLKLMQP
ncbi:MAG: glycerol-3-phosphate acyltransferase [Deltaproteobacteria bacterium]|nr:glycerol-3-phosphate acyltransferase [Deltaproteobacteria bacterium]